MAHELGGWIVAGSSGLLTVHRRVRPPVDRYRYPRPQDRGGLCRFEGAQMGPDARLRANLPSPRRVAAQRPGRVPISPSPGTSRCPPRSRRCAIRTRRSRAPARARLARLACSGGRQKRRARGPRQSSSLHPPRAARRHQTPFAGSRGRRGAGSFELRVRSSVTTARPGGRSGRARSGRHRRPRRARARPAPLAAGA